MGISELGKHRFVPDWFRRTVMMWCVISAATIVLATGYSIYREGLAGISDPSAWWRFVGPEGQPTDIYTPALPLADLGFLLIAFAIQTISFFVVRRYPRRVHQM
jgi:hypothetical protein